MMEQEQTPARTAPFQTHRCECCKNHVPLALEVELHHLHPQADQKALWGEIRNRTLIPLCRTAHRNLHVYLAALIAQQPVPRVNAYTARLARQGFQLINEAHATTNGGTLIPVQNAE